MSTSLFNFFKTMAKNVAVLTAVCLLLCLSFNYTFPMHRDSTTQKATPLDNHSQPSEHINQEHNDGIAELTKKVAMSLENALKKFIDSTPNKSKAKCSHKHGVIDNDLSNYEQLVIMKKYPFLDLQELDFNLNPLTKNTAQNLNSAQVLAAQDPSFCESLDEGPSVEITNRGLSGFALPTKFAKNENSVANKKDKVNSKTANETVSNDSSTVKDLPDDLRLIESLEEDIKIFEQHMP